MRQKIVLATPPTVSHRTSEETLAIQYLASILREAGYDVSLIDGWLEKLTVSEILERMSIGGFPDLLGVSSYSSNIEQSVLLLRAAKEKFAGIPVICGGFGPTFSDEHFLRRGFDVVVRGEAEGTIASLVDAILSGKGIAGIPGVSFIENNKVIRTRRAETLENLDALPFPVRVFGSVVTGLGNYTHLCTSRGCEGHCIYCSVFAFALGGSFKRRWRGRSVENIVEEIRFLYERFGVRHFKFVDDSFIEPPRDEDWAKHFRDELLRFGLRIKFRTQVRADRLNPEIVSVLREAGWFSTSVGIESGSRTALRRMLKSASLSQNIEALHLLNSEGIYTQMGLILFDDETTLLELRENLQFLKRFSWPMRVINKGIFTEMYAARGTIFARKLAGRGQLIEDRDGNLRYLIADENARRVYQMLKSWHRSHSRVFDWVIDPLTAPKILTDAGYRRVHFIFGKLQALDLQFFEHALDCVSGGQSVKKDDETTQDWIERTKKNYEEVEMEIGNLYRQFGLLYDAALNPFL